MKLSPSSRAGLRLVNLAPRDKPASPVLYMQQFGRITRPRIDSAAWTGRQPRQSFRWWLQGVLWPSYACEQCVGQDWGQGCYCAYQGALAPGGPGPGWLRWRGRHLWSWWFK